MRNGNRSGCNTNAWRDAMLLKNTACRVLAVALLAMLTASRAGAAGLVVDSTGMVGIGTSAPATLLEVNNGSIGGQVLGLVTTGSSVKLGLNSSLANWTIANQASTKFRIREVSSAAIAFELDTSGNAVLPGSVTALNFIPTSARAAKTDIIPVNEREILAQMNRLPVFKWRYKADESRQSQVGPMAEDFKDTFGIGDGQHLSLVAANGLSFAAIKGLSEVVDERTARLEALVQAKDTELEELRRTNAQFAERLAALESRDRD
jgi:hypothetical protein